MAIAMAQQKGSMVFVYDERNIQLWSRLGELLWIYSEYCDNKAK